MMELFKKKETGKGENKVKKKQAFTDALKEIKSEAG